MKINQQLDGVTLTIALEGRLDTNTAPEVEAVFKSCLSGITHLILDMTHLDYLSSAGLRVILMAQKIMNKQGDLVDKLVDVAHSLHTTSHQIEGRESIFTSAKELFLHHLSINPILSPEEKSLCSQFIESIPDRDTLIHGDFHPGNIMLSDGEALLIDIADICYGHPIFDLVTLHFTLVSVPQFSKYRDKKGLTRIGLTDEKSSEVWSYFIQKYFADFPTDNEKSEILEQITALSILRMTCLLTMHNRHFSENDIRYFQDSVRERLIPVLPDMIGKVTW